MSSAGTILDREVHNMDREIAKLLTMVVKRKMIRAEFAEAVKKLKSSVEALEKLV